MVCKSRVCKSRVVPPTTNGQQQAVPVSRAPVRSICDRCSSEELEHSREMSERVARARKGKIEACGAYHRRTFCQLLRAAHEKEGMSKSFPPPPPPPLTPTHTRTHPAFFLCPFSSHVISLTWTLSPPPEVYLSHKTACMSECISKTNNRRWCVYARHMRCNMHGWGEKSG